MDLESSVDEINSRLYAIEHGITNLDTEITALREALKEQIKDLRGKRYDTDKNKFASPATIADIVDAVEDVRGEYRRQIADVRDVLAGIKGGMTSSLSWIVILLIAQLAVLAFRIHL